MLGIAGFFLLLDSPFVAMFQILVYVGAVAVLIIFTVMLVRTQALFSTKEDKGRKGFWSCPYAYIYDWPRCVVTSFRTK